MNFDKVMKWPVEIKGFTKLIPNYIGF